MSISIASAKHNLTLTWSSLSDISKATSISRSWVRNDHDHPLPPAMWYARQTNSLLSHFQSEIHSVCAPININLMQPNPVCSFIPCPKSRSVPLLAFSYVFHIDEIYFELFEVKNHDFSEFAAKFAMKTARKTPNLAFVRKNFNPCLVTFRRILEICVKSGNLRNFGSF